MFEKLTKSLLTRVGRGAPFDTKDECMAEIERLKRELATEKDEGKDAENHIDMLEKALAFRSQEVHELRQQSLPTQGNIMSTPNLQMKERQNHGVYPNGEYFGFRGAGFPSLEKGLIYYEGNAGACQHPPDCYAGAITLTRGGEEKEIADVFFLIGQEDETGQVGYCIRHSNIDRDYGSMLDLSPWFFMEQKGWVDSHRLRRLFFAWCERENLVISPKGWSPDIEVQKGHVHIYSEDDVIPSNKPEQCRGFRCLQTLEDVYKHTGIHPARMEEQEIHEYIPSRMEWLKDNAQVLPVPGQEYHYIFVPRTDPPMDNPRLSLNQFRNDIRNETGKEIAVFITPDPRGPGYALFRNEDHPGVEFGRLKSSSCAVIQAETSFVHTGGFYATTPSLEPKILVRLVSAACDKPA